MVNDVKLTFPRWWTRQPIWSSRIGHLYISMEKLTISPTVPFQLSESHKKRLAELTGMTYLLLWKMNETTCTMIDNLAEEYIIHENCHWCHLPHG